jgi:hypothetical protein
MMRLPTLLRTGELLALHVPLSLALHDAVPTFCNSGLMFASIYSCLWIQVSFTSFTSTALTNAYSFSESQFTWAASIEVAHTRTGLIPAHMLPESMEIMRGFE